MMHPSCLFIKRYYDLFNSLQKWQLGSFQVPLFLHLKHFWFQDDFLVWQFFLFCKYHTIGGICVQSDCGACHKTFNWGQSTHVPSDGKRLCSSNRTIELNGESRRFFDASPALEKARWDPRYLVLLSQGRHLMAIFSRNWLKPSSKSCGRLWLHLKLRIEPRPLRTIKTNPELVKAALCEAVFNGKPNWKYIQAILV